MADSKIRAEKIGLNVSDGTHMDCYVAHPTAGGEHAALIVLQEAFGVNSHIRDVTHRFAREGYLAIAPELFHRTAPGFEGNYNDFNSVMPHMRAMTNEGAEADLRAAFQWLESQSAVQRGEISAVGFCMGGRIAFLANAALPLRAAASFYGGGIAPGLLDRVESLHAPMLLVWGELDKHIPAEQRAQVIDALKQKGKTYVNVEFSDADHAFFCDERAAYQPRAARQSWALLLEFLRTAGR